MATSNLAIFPKTLKTFAAKIVTSDSTNKVTLLTAGTDGTVLDALQVSSTDTSSRILLLYLNSGGVDYLLTTFAISANSGSNTGIVPVDLLRNIQFTTNAFDANGNRFLRLSAGSSLKIAVTSALTSTKEIACVAQGVDY
jgi:hypothetical protein